MIDFLLGALFVALIMRGWVKGFVREALDVLTLLLGAVVAFRFMGTVGGVIAAMAGIPQEAARLVGGVVAFLAISIGAAFVSGLIHRTMRRLPALTTLNRLAGAGLGALYALVVVTLALTLVSVFPTPVAMTERLEQSTIATTLTDPQGPMQRGVEAMAGDRVMQSVISLRRLVGERTVASSGVVALPPPQGQLHPSGDAARAVYASLNRERVSEGLDPLAWSDELAVLAVTRASAAYRSGDLTTGPGPVDEHLANVGILSSVEGETVALAATADGAHEALVGSVIHKAQMLESRYRRVGVGVVSGPYGLVTVEVFAG